MNSRINEKTESSLSIKIFLPIILLIIGGAVAFYFITKKPEMKKKRPKKQSTLVEVVSVKPGNHQSAINAMGTVTPDSKIILKSKVSGEVTIVSDNFVQGGVVQKGELLLKIDDSDYKIEIQKAQSELDKAISALEMEKGSQLIAKEELKLINEASEEKIASTDLALRKPQLIQAKAALKSAEASLEKAELNLKRTDVVAPFNAIILEKNISLGSLLPVQGTIATLADIDTYLVEALIPPDKLETISINQNPDEKNAVIESQYSNQTWEGKIVRTTGKISEKSRMAGVLIAVSDPLGLKSNDSKGRLLIDDHVNIKIMGRMLTNVFPVPRAIVRDNDTLWIYNDGALDIRKVKIVWKEDNQVYIESGITPKDKIIVSDIPSAINGMILRLNSGGSK